RLNRVLLPAPLGPISAVMAPRWTSRWSTSTATRPPNALRSESTTRIGSGFAAPGVGSTPARRERATGPEGSATMVGSDAVSSSKRDLLLAAEDALRAERQHEHQDQPDEREAERSPGLVALQEPGEPVVAV